MNTATRGLISYVIGIDILLVEYLPTLLSVYMYFALCHKTLKLNAYRGALTQLSE